MRVLDTGTMQSLMNPGGNGRFIVVLDPQRKAPGQQAHQGIVPIVGETIADALSHYMQQSEQLDTRLWLAADENHAAGMLLQRMPGQVARRRPWKPHRNPGTAPSIWRRR